MNLEYDTESLFQSEKFCICTKRNYTYGLKNVHEWAWDDTFVSATSEFCEHKLEVMFHPRFSIGTAVVRGNTPMTKGRHHYWEVEMITPVYGTDVMVGVGTSNMDLTGIGETFCSLLGRDRESWGYSYQGYLQHGGETRVYNGRFGQDHIVGVLLDTWRGTLTFFLNRISLGIAFTGLRDVVLYPMVSSTAAKSKIRITYCCSVPASLQMDCLSVLESSQIQYLSNTFPGLKYLSESVFADILKKHPDDDINDAGDDDSDNDSYVSSDEGSNKNTDDDSDNDSGEGYMNFLLNLQF